MKVRTNKSRTAIVAVTALALVGIVAGIAHATSPTLNTTLVGCYAKKSGALRLTAPTKKCSKSEKRTSWNSKGIQGPQGLPGAKGETGAKGDTGPSNGYFDNANAIKALNDTGAEVVTLNNVPAGSYVFNFTTDYRDGAGGGTINCAIKTGADTIDSLVAEVEAGRRTNIAMTGAATLVNPADVTVICDDNGGDETTVFAHITAVHVGALAQL